MGDVDDGFLALADEFPPVSEADWRRAVDEVLAGQSFDVLRSITIDGIVVEPLYTRADERPVEQHPGPGSSRRAGSAAGLTGGWDIRQRHELTSAVDTNAAILADLGGGVTSIELATDGIDSAATLASVLDGVMLDVAPVALVGPGAGVEPARWLLELAIDREASPVELAFDLGCDPIGSLARHGTAGSPIEEALAAVGTLAAGPAATLPRARVARADGTPYADAGASPATELAATVATAVEYLRVFTDAGLGEAAALGNVLLSVTVGPDQFAGIAKLRALRVVWARVAEACGAGGHTAVVQATTATSVMARHDPWTNMLRGTLGCFAAAVGGADIVTVHPFDAVIGVPDELGRRIARNTQLALMEESNLHRVIDPGGGSWYLEQLTDSLAGEAWRQFQQIEGEGGIVAALGSGALQERIHATYRATEAALVNREVTLVGVNEFVDLDAEPLDRPPHRPAPTAAGEPECDPLPQRRLADIFERLHARGVAASDQGAGP